MSKARHENTWHGTAPQGSLPDSYSLMTAFCLPNITHNLISVQRQSNLLTWSNSGKAFTAFRECRSNRAWLKPSLPFIWTISLRERFTMFKTIINIFLCIKIHSKFSKRKYEVLVVTNQTGIDQSLSLFSMKFPLFASPDGIYLLKCSRGIVTCTENF